MLQREGEAEDASGEEAYGAGGDGEDVHAEVMMVKMSYRECNAGDGKRQPALSRG